MSRISKEKIKFVSNLLMQNYGQIKNLQGYDREIKRKEMIKDACFLYDGIEEYFK